MNLVRNLRNFSLTQKSSNALQNQVRTLLCGQNEITDKNQIIYQLHHFYNTFYRETLNSK